MGSFAGDAKKTMWEVRRQRENGSFIRGLFCSAQSIGARSYLGPNSGSLHVPIEGVYSPAEKIEDRVAIGEKTAQNHVGKAARTYLDRIRNLMQKPVEGLLASFHALSKGEGSQTESNSSLSPQRIVLEKYLRQHTAPKNTRKQHAATEKPQFTKHPTRQQSNIP